MAKFLCVCGETIRTSGEIPSPDQWMIMSDVELDQYAQGVNVRAINHLRKAARAEGASVLRIEGTFANPDLEVLRQRFPIVRQGGREFLEIAVK